MKRLEGSGIYQDHMKLSVMVVLALCACVPDLSNVDQAVGSSNCDDWGCGMNSPNIDSHGFHFLYQNGAQNPEGMAITELEIGGAPYTFGVHNGYISGTNSAGTVVSGAALVGARLHVSYFGTPMYLIEITSYGRVLSWAKSSTGARFVVPTYRFYWAPVSDPGKLQDLCKHPGVDSTLGMNEYDTLVFEGDVIDATYKKVSPTVDSNVVNFGCAGGTLAKQHLTGHTAVASRYGFTTTTAERTAMLKMLTADYCGDGTPHTIGGEPLTWADDHGWMQASAGATTEAEWTASGMTCLSTPRLQWTDPTHYPTLRSDIETECGGAPIPVCTGAPSFPTPGNHLVSANP